jgi:hypothetical protein
VMKFAFASALRDITPSQSGYSRGRGARLGAHDP